MALAATTLAVGMILIDGMLLIALVSENIKVIDQKRKLAQRLDGIERDLHALGPNATAEQLKPIQARIADYERDWKQFCDSPFVYRVQR